MSARPANQYGLVADARASAILVVPPPTTRARAGPSWHGAAHAIAWCLRRVLLQYHDDGLSLNKNIAVVAQQHTRQLIATLAE